MTENFKVFLEKVSSDPDLKKKFEEEFNDGVEKKLKENTIRFASRIGLDLDESDFVAEEKELDLDELDAVAGGGFCYCTFYGGGASMDCECKWSGEGDASDGDSGGCGCWGEGAGADA